MTTTADNPAPHITYEEGAIRAALARECRDSFEFFVREFFQCIPGVGALSWNWHLTLFCEELQSIAIAVRRSEQKDHDLVVNVPFGTTKSSIISILFQCWVWSWWPQARFLCGTHTDSLALNLAQRTKDVIESDKYRETFPDVVIRKDVSAKEDFANTLGGERKSCTVGGKTPMGRHSHFCILDDPLDPQGVYSNAVIDTASRFITEVVPSRVVDKGVVPIILVMQRLHPRDPSAVMLALGRVEGSTPVRHICLPGELAPGAATPSPSLEELKFRWPEAYEGGLLDVKRLSKRALADLRGKLTRFAYGGQVLQNPVLPGGGIFEEVFFGQRAKCAPYESNRIRYWDRAATAEGGCATAGVLMAVDKEGYYYIEDVVYGHWGPRERNQKILAVSRRDRARYGPRFEPLIVIEGERGSTGEESYSHLARMLTGFRIREDLPSGSKDVRAEPLSDQFAAGNVYLVDNGESMGIGRALWDIQGYIEEFVSFRPEPGSGKRVGGLCDRVDATSGAFNILSGRKQLSGGFRVLPSRRGSRDGMLRIVVCSTDNCGEAIIEERALLIYLMDPVVERTVDHVTSDDPARVLVDDGTLKRPRNALVELPKEVQHESQDLTVLSENAPAGGDVPPGPSLVRSLGELTLRFADIAPSELQDRWEEPVAPWGEPPEKLIMTAAEGKKLWSFITRKRDPQPEVIVIVDCRKGVMPDEPMQSVRGISRDEVLRGTGNVTAPGRRALSAAYALADVLRPGARNAMITDLSNPDGDRAGPAPNEHVYNITKLSRNYVV